VPIVYRDSDAYRTSVELDVDKVIGDSDTILGDSSDSVAGYVNMLYGRPLQQLRAVDDLRIGRAIKRDIDDLRIGRAIKRDRLPKGDDLQ